MNLFAAYLLAVGGFTAGVQVARGVVRGAGKLIDGEPGAAFAEAAGGLVAPLFSAYAQVCKLGEDVWQVAGSLAGTGKEEENLNPPGFLAACTGHLQGAFAANGR